MMIGRGRLGLLRERIRRLLGGLPPHVQVAALPWRVSGDGLREIPNPSEAFLAERPQSVAGSCVTASLEGSRPLLLEVQALLTDSIGGSPRRNCVGVDAARLAMLMAVLQRHGHRDVLREDVFVNVAGGMRLFEPAADLAVLLAVASSHSKRALPAGLVAIGEVGLTGEIRQVPRIEQRLAEAARLGFEQALIAKPPRGRAKAIEAPSGIELILATNVEDALAAVGC